MKYLSFILFACVTKCVFAQEKVQIDSPKTQNIFLDPLQKTNLDTLVGRVTQTGLATYYAHKFEGRKTTSGARYRGKKLTAAHRTLPFGTVVTVTNLRTNKSVNVVVNDRGPFVKRILIDVSKSAAKKIGFFGQGITPVSITYTLPK